MFQDSRELRLVPVMAGATARRGAGLYGVAEGNLRVFGARREGPLSLYPSALLRNAPRPSNPLRRAA